ncbi:MAG: hypothetical protein O2805_09375 [Proteobacteria bacterium]|nr:hypothetical protein [Pseudomonadota bacterium]
MSILRQQLGLLALALLATGTASADNNFGLGVKAGTLGLGLEASWQPLPYLEVRLGANAYDYDDTGSEAGIDYNGTLTLESFYGTVNFHFPISPMRITAGIYSNGNELYLLNDDLQDTETGGIVFPGAGIGVLESTTSFASSAPYLGIGFDFTLAGKVGMNLDFGVLWQDEPKVTLIADGALAGIPGFDAALELERLQLEDKMSDFKAWPVISLGFVYKF